MRFLVTLLVVAGLVSGWFLLQNHRRERQERSWAVRLKERLDPLVATGGRGEAGLPDEAAFFRMIYFLRNAEAGGADRDKMISDAVDLLGLPGNAASLVRESVDAAYATSGGLQLFEDIGNDIRLEKGEPAVIRAPGWQDEMVCAGQILPPLLAPEAAGHLANLRLMPVAVRDAQGDAPTAYTLERARLMEQARIITRESLDRIQTAARAAPD